MKQLFRALLYFSLVFLVSCGVRKSSVKVEKTKEYTEKSSEVQKQETRTEERTQEKKEIDSNDIVAEGESRITHEILDTLGRVTERITSIQKSKVIDRSTKERKSLEGAKTTQILKIDSTGTEKKETEVKVKEKETQKSNTIADSVGGSWTVIAIVVLLLVAGFVYLKYIFKK